MGCIDREWDHVCEDDCPVCCPEVGEAHRAAYVAWLEEQSAWRERALAAEALVRAKDEAIGELLGLLDFFREETILALAANRRLRGEA